MMVCPCRLLCRRIYGLTTSALLAVFLAGCGSSGGPNDRPTQFIIRIGGAGAYERFIVKVTDPAKIQRARDLLASGEATVVSGTLAEGDDGYNRDPVKGTAWTWHMTPETVTFPDAAIEVCDGRPSAVEADKPYWIGRLGYFCPWTSVVEGEVGL
jgi:hypothetical protein